MPTSKTIRVLSFIHKHGGSVNISQIFRDTSTSISDTQIIRERKQEAGGRTFVVNSVFDRFAGKTAGDKLLSLVEMNAEKEVRKTL